MVKVLGILRDSPMTSIYFYLFLSIYLQDRSGGGDGEGAWDPGRLSDNFYLFLSIYLQDWR